MDAERARAFLLSLPHVVETVQWGGNLVFWVGDKHLGGKMFAVIDITRPTKVISYAAGPEHYAELLEQDGLLPAPYMARLFWVAAETWSAHRDPAWAEELRAAHTLTLNKLPPNTRAALLLPATQRKRLIAARKRLIAQRQEFIPDRKQLLPASHHPPQPTRPTKASKAASLETAARQARPKKHRQS